MITDSKTKIPVICLFGPTAVGKTDFLLSFEKTCEIINADSMQVYKFMNIGTAKADDEIRNKIPHHLIDICDIKEQFDTGKFVEHADRLCREIRERKKIPLLSGGTAFYFINFINGLPQTPRSNPEIKQKYINLCDQSGSTVLWKQLEEIDPETAARLSPNDKNRVIRALEVFETSGKPLSSFKPGKGRFDLYDFFICGLRMDRSELYRRIDKRVDIMFEYGLEAEVNELLKRGYSFDDPGFQGIGYKEFRGFLTGNQTDRKSLDLLKKEIAKNSRRYAKRQITFFNKIENTLWYSPDQSDQLKEDINVFQLHNSGL